MGAAERGEPTATGAWRRRGTLLLLWLGLIAVAWAGPVGDDADGQRVVRWFRLQGEPSLVAVFNMLGVWPMAYATVLLSDRGRIPAWPFVMASFVVGGFVLLPYLAVRRWSAPLPAAPSRIERVATSRWVGAGLWFATWSLVAFALVAGSAEAYRAQWKLSSLVYTMSADFVAVTLAWWPVLADDRKRRGGPNWAALVGAVPVVGMPVWITLRNRPASCRPAAAR